MRHALFLLACLLTGLAAPATVAGVLTGHLPLAAAPAALPAALLLGFVLSAPFVLAPTTTRFTGRIRFRNSDADGNDAAKTAAALAAAHVAVWLGRRMLAAEWLLVAWLTGRRVAATRR